MTRHRAMILFFPPLALTAPMLEAFGTLDIPIVNAPSATLFGGLFVFGLLLGGLGAILLPPSGTGHRLRHAAYVAVLAGIVLLAIDVAANGHQLLMRLAASRASRVGIAVGAAVGLFGVLWPIRKYAAPLLFVASCAFFGSTVALNASVFRTWSEQQPAVASAPADTDRPPFIYIVLDGAMGVEGLDAAPGGRALATEIRELFNRYGFRVHGAAFSRHYVSVRSIPNTLNFDFRDDSWGSLLRHHENLKVRSALFSRLAADGYEVISYGTEHIDFCFAEALRCEVLPSFNPFSAYVDNPRAQFKAVVEVLWTAFTESYLMYRYYGFLYSLVEEGPRSGYAWLDTYAFPRWFDRFEGDVVSSPRGRAFFAHILMPHAPYVFDDACRETGRATVAYLLTEERRLRGTALEEARDRGYRDYQAQYRCGLGRMERLLRHLESVPEFADATIVVHGDHGPRISAGQHVESLSARDMVDNYSTLYAVRAPDLEPGYDTRLVSIQRLTAEYFGGEDLERGPAVPTVVVDSEEQGKVEVLPMPSFAAVAAQGEVERVTDDASDSQ
jgi:hypothetical protein